MMMDQTNFLSIRRNMAEAALAEADARIKLAGLYDAGNLSGPDVDDARSDVFHYEGETKRYRAMHEWFREYSFYVEAA